MNQDIIREKILQRFELITLLGSITAVAFVAEFLNPLISIKFSYVFLAAVLMSSSGYISDIHYYQSENQLLKLSLSTVLVFFSCTLIFGPHFIIFFVFLGVLSFQIAINVINKGTVEGILFQAILIVFAVFVFLLSDTGIYIGNVDPIWQHYPNVNKLLETGDINQLNERYESFPLMHIVISEIALITGLSSYQSSVPFLFISSMIFVAIAFVFTKNVTNEDAAKYAALFVPGLYLITFHLPIVFPQSMATIFVLLLMVSSVMATKRRFYLLGSLTIALVLTHHLAIFIFIIFSPLIYLMHKSKRINTLYLVGIAAVVHWLYIGESFLTSIAFASERLVTNILSSTPTTTTSLRMFGTELQSETVTSAVFFFSFVEGNIFRCTGHCTTLRYVLYFEGKF